MGLIRRIENGTTTEQDARTVEKLCERSNKIMVRYFLFGIVVGIAILAFLLNFLK